MYWFWTEQGLERRRRDQPLPPADKIHHVLEDFSANWDRPLSHVKPLNLFLRRTLNDLYDTKCASSSNMFSKYKDSTKSLDSQFCIVS